MITLDFSAPASKVLENSIDYNTGKIDIKSFRKITGLVWKPKPLSNVSRYHFSIHDEKKYAEFLLRYA